VPKGVFVRLDHIEAAGDVISGLLLSQLSYLQKNLGPGYQITKGDLSDQTGLTGKQLRRCLPVLSSRGLIEYKSLSGRGNVTGLHVVVTCSNDPTIKRCAERAPLCGPKGMFKDAERAPDSLYKENKEESISMPSKKPSVLEALDAKRSSSVAEALKKVHDARPKKPDVVKAVNQFWILWLRLHEENWPGYWVKPWTMDDKGKATHLIKTVPSDVLVQALENAIGNWGQFIGFVERETTAFNLPEKPDIGFLVKYAGSLVNFETEYDDEDSLVKTLDDYLGEA